MNVKRTVAATGAALLLIGGGTAAYAYWTTTGAGSGTGNVAASNGTLVLSATFPTVGLYPGGSVTVNFKATNAGATDLQVGTISSVVTTSDPLCLPADFTIAPVAANQVIPAGTTAAMPASNITATGTLAFANTAANQDKCKSATITLTLSS